MNQMTHPDLGTDLQQEFARGLLDILRKNVEMAERLAGQVMPEPARAALIDRQDATSRREIVAAAPKPAQVEVPASRSSTLDDPEFEAALVELADREGWWQDDPDEIVEQFDMMLVGLLVFQEEYVNHCVRKGLDPATALPSVARLAGGFQAVAEAVGVKTPAPQAKKASSAPTKPANSFADLDSTPVSEFATRYLDLRCQGYPLQRKTETPDEKSGKSFRANSRRNIEATVGLFVDICSDIPVADIQSHHCADFVGLLARIPSTHGKSSENRLSVRETIEMADRTESAEIDKLAIRLRRDGRSPGEIEDAISAARIERLRTATCVRHMRDFSRIFDFAVFDGVRTDNPMKEHLWTAREEKSRRHREKTVERTGSGDHQDGLLASPIYRGPLEEPGDPQGNRI